MINQDYYGNIEFDNRESNVLLITQRQSFGSFNIVFVKREHIDELIEQLDKLRLTKKQKQIKHGR